MNKTSVSPQKIHTARRRSIITSAQAHRPPPCQKFLLFGLLSLATSVGAHAQDYIAKDLYIAAAPASYVLSNVAPGQEVVALGQYVQSATAPDGVVHALLWLPPDGQVVDLHPAASKGSIAYATDGHQQVGTSEVSLAHAALWNGTPESAVDLNPTAAGFHESNAYGVGGGQQVGSGVGAPATGNYTHALLWSGTAASAVDLNPAAFSSSTALGADGEQQVGYGYNLGSPAHALLWSGTAESVVDLHEGPLAKSFSDSVAYGVGGGQQVGILSNNSPAETHAAIWSGTAASVVDLHPSDARGSNAYATNGHIQVGDSISFPPSFSNHARLWKGTAESSVDLDNLLPSYLSYSTAFSIDAAGNIFGLAYDTSDGTPHAVEWLTQAANLANISSRAYVETGDNVLIAGFIVNGTQDKPILIRGLGPSLALPPINLPSVLEDPTLELHDSTGAIIGSNDNWKNTQQDMIEATGIAPTEDAEAAILASLPPGAYTAILRGVKRTVGNALVEFYDLDTSLDSRLPNISSRGLVRTGDDVIICGFIVGGAKDGNVLIRAIGPSLTGVSDALSDPTLELHDATGALIASNNDWKETQQAAIEATGIPPTEDKESAILTTLAPGSYTAIVRGMNNTVGIALVEAYQLAPTP